MILKTLRQSILTYVRRGIQYTSGLFPKLNIPLKTSLVPSIGASTPTFSRTTTGTVIDFEGSLLTALINELRFPGARRVRNLLSNTEILSTQTVTVSSGTSYILSFSGTGSVILSGAATGTLSGSTGRVQVTKSATTSSLTLTVIGSVLQAQLEKVTGTQTVASEYISAGVLSWPYHGACVDGVKYFNTDREGNILESNGSLIEQSATNLGSYSNSFNSWTKSGIAVTSNYSSSPLGDHTSSLLTNTITGQPYMYEAFSCISGKLYSFSIFAKAGLTNFISMTFSTVSFSNLGYAIFNLSNGVVSSAISCSAGMKYIGNGWYRCSIYNTASSTLSSSSVLITPSYEGANRATGTSGSTIEVCGAQVENGITTSYTPTSGTAVTRTADILSYDIGDVITQGQGSLYCEAVFKELLSSTTYILSLDDATSSNMISLYIDSGTTLNVTMTSSGSSTVTSSMVTVSKDSVYKIMITYKNNSFKVYINGTLVLTDTSCTVPTVTFLRFSRYNNSGQTNIQIKDFMYYKEVLKQAEAERRTS